MASGRRGWLKSAICAVAVLTVLSTVSGRAANKPNIDTGGEFVRPPAPGLRSVNSGFSLSASPTTNR
jgi:hypothetical protein